MPQPPEPSRALLQQARQDGMVELCWDEYFQSVTTWRANQTAESIERRLDQAHDRFARMTAIWLGFISSVIATCALMFAIYHKADLAGFAAAIAACVGTWFASGRTVPFQRKGKRTQPRPDQASDAEPATPP